MSRRRILITGATGGLGVALVREAAALGHDVRCVGRSPGARETLEPLGAEFVERDLALPRADLRDLVRGCDSVIHAAALSASWGSRETFAAANVRMTERLLAAASVEAVARFVFVSSPSIFASFRDRLDIGEYDPPAAKPLNHYARTKLAAERIVLAPRRDGMACCAIRPRALVGPGDRVILPRLASLIQRRRMPLPRGGEALIELTDLRDAARAICEAEERAPGLAGRAINVSGGRPVTVGEVARGLAEAIGASPRPIAVPAGIARIAATLLERSAQLRGAAAEPTLTRYSLATIAYSQTFDQEPARRLLGFRPEHDALATLLEQARLSARGQRP